jgi:hypothetical protein
MDPTRATAGGPGFVLTVGGSGFAQADTSAQVAFRDVLVFTQPEVLLPNQILFAKVPASLLVTPGSADVHVEFFFGPYRKYTGMTNSLRFAIEVPVPELVSVNPTSAWAKSIAAPPLVTLSGANFYSATKAVVNSVERPTTFLSANTITVQLTASDVASPGTLVIQARNPQPGGGTSSGLPFTVGSDATAPVSTLSGADTNWHNAPVTLGVAATDTQSGVQKSEWGIGTVPPWTTLSGTTITVPAPADHSGDGAEIVSVRSTDNCNNVETPAATVTVQIDTTGPTTAATASGSIKRGKDMVLGYRADETLSPTCAIVLTITKSNGASAKTFTLGQKPSSVTGNYRFKCTLAKGKYKYSVFATDLAGNAQTSVGSKIFKVK